MSILANCHHGESMGGNIYIDANVSGAKISGSDIYVSGANKGLAIFGSSGIAVYPNVNYSTVLNSNGGSITQSNALYINNLPIKDTASAVRVKSITANYTTDWYDTILLVNATGGNITITLPDSGLVASTKDEMGKIFYIKKVDASANTVTVDGYSTQTIDGATTKVLTTQYDSISIVSDGSNWHII